MALVDKKGKLFGKVNLIDALVVIVIVLALAVAGMFLFGKTMTTTAKTSDNDVAIVTTQHDVPNTVDVPLKKGQKIRESSIVDTWGIIEDVTISPKIVQAVDTKTNKPFTYKSLTDNTVVVKIRVNGTFRDGGFYRAQENVKPGTIIQFETPEYKFAGTVTDVAKAK